jgi:hypothetical protein
VLALGELVVLLAKARVLDKFDHLDIAHGEVFKKRAKYLRLSGII